MRTCSEADCGRKHYAHGWCQKHYKAVRANGTTEPRGTVRGAPKDFISAAIASNADGCIQWPFFCDRAGYARAWDGSRMERVARIVLLETEGPPEKPGMYACHAPIICHNPKCINPRHLRWATPAENSRDCKLDGTTNSGERNGASKLTAQQVVAIRQSTGSCVSVGRAFGVSSHCVSLIRRGKRWATVGMGIITVQGGEVI